MSTTKRATSDSQITHAALKLAAQGWSHVTLEKIAKATKTSLAKLKTQYTHTHDLIPLIADIIDREAFATIAPSGAPHDILFDLLMARFDVLQKYRAAILNMAVAARHDKKLACTLGRAVIDGTYRLIEESKLKKPPRPILALGLITIYAAVFIVWQKDKSRDMAKTMAALDRALGWADKGTEFLKRYSSRAKA